MNKGFLFLSAVSIMFLPALSAQAKDKTDGKSSSLAVEKLMCDKYKSASDVAFKPGVDVNGNPVAPADLAPEAVKLPDYLELPLSVDLGKKIGVSLGDGVEAKAVVGNLKLYQDGRVEYNGQDVSGQVASFCGVAKPPVAAGQGATGAPAGVSGAVSGSTMPSFSNPVPAPAAPMMTGIEPTTPQAPIAGAVVSSSTVEPPAPKPAFDLPNHTVNTTR